MIYHSNSTRLKSPNMISCHRPIQVANLSVDSCAYLLLSVLCQCWKFLSIECLRKRKYPAGTPGFGNLPPSNFKFPPQIDESRILYIRDLGYIRDISVCANTLLSRGYKRRGGSTNPKSHSSFSHQTLTQLPTTRTYSPS